MANTTISKVTKVQKFNAIKGLIPEVIEVNGIEVNIAEFLDNEVALIQKKASSKSAKVSEEDTKAFAEVTEFLADGRKSPTEVMAGCGLKSTQKATAILKKLADNGTVVKIVEGKKVFYTLV